MASVPSKIAKAIIPEDKDFKESLESPTSVITNNSLNAPKGGTIIPNRVFVGGISSATTEADLVALFSNYGTVIGAKIISDRAGVSKGYGFVTFETEDEAKRLQKDGFGRAASYDCSPATSVPMASQVYRQNGIPCTYHNGMAFFQPPTPQPLPPTNMEPQAVYQPGAPYAAVPQGSPAPMYQYPYSPGQVIYQGPQQYQYHIPQFEGCYDSQVVMHDANLVLPQYYFAPHEVTYFQPTPMHPQEQSPLQHQIMYTTSPRAFEPPLVYAEPSTESSEASSVQVQEADTSATNTVTTTSANNGSPHNEITTTSEANLRKGRETPVVSLLKVNNNNKESIHYGNKGGYHGNNSHYHLQQGQLRRKPRQFDDHRRPHLNNNNNNPDAANRNLMSYNQVQQQQQQPSHQRGGRRGSAASGDGVDLSAQQLTYPSNPPRPPNVPYYYPRQVLSPASNLNNYYNHPPPHLPHRTRSFFHRPRYGGAGGGRGGGRGGGHHHHLPPPREGGKWSGTNGKDESSQPLTPPITPKSESGKAATPIPPQTDDIVKSIQAVTI